MQPKLRFIAISQRVVEVPSHRETRDCLDQAWAPWLQSLGLVPVPVPNEVESPSSFVEQFDPVGIILSGGNNVAFAAYEGEEVVTDAYASRDRTERALVEYALARGMPVLGCCHGMQFLHAFFGGKLSPLSGSPVPHVARDHEVQLSGPDFTDLNNAPTLTVNSFHNYGIRSDALPTPLKAFAHTKNDNSVEAFKHRDAPIVGIMWHPERKNPGAAFDRKLALQMFRNDEQIA